jgi:hypothetical protein
VAANHQQTIVINVDKKQLKAFFKELGLVQKRIQKINQTGLQLNRVRSRTRNIRGTGLNLGTSENRQAPGRNPSARVKQQTAALNKANAELNKYVRTLSTADGAQRGFTGSANKMSTQVSALRDRLRGLARSNSEYTSTLQAVQRGEQALFQDRNKRLGDESRTLGSRGGAKDLVPGLLKATDITQSVDGLNNYISRLETLKNKVNINSKEFQQLQARIAEVNQTLEKTQFNKVKEVKQKRFPQTELGSPQEFQQRQQFAEQRQTIEEQIANTAQRINNSKLKAVTKEKLLNDLKRSGLKLEQNQFKVAKQINIETQKNLIAQEKAQARRARITSSALIGGGFPLLFGGGPLQAIGGAIGGGIGESITPGGGFAGSIAMTALISKLSQFTEGVKSLSLAIDPLQPNLELLVSSLGLQGTTTGNLIAKLQKAGQETKALEIATQQLALLVGQQGVDALETFGQDSLRLSNEFAKAMTQMQVAVAEVINSVGALRALANQLEKATLFRQAQKSDDPILKELFKERTEASKGFLLSGSAPNFKKVAETENKIIDRQRKLNQKNLPSITVGGSQDFSEFDLNVLNKRIALQKVGDDLLNEEVVRKKEALILAERALAIAQADGDAIKIAIAEGTAELKINELNTAVDEKRQNLIDKRQNLIDNTIGKLSEEKLFLEESLTLGKDKAEIEKTIRDLVKDLPPERHAEVRALVEGNEVLKERNKLTQEQKQLQEEVKNILAGGMTNAVMGLIDGSRTLGQVLADIAKQLASMFLNKAFSSLFSNMFSGGGGGGGGGSVGALPASPIYVAAQGGFSRAGGFKAFQSGGVVNSPTLGMVGEGGESEYVIPASKMSGAMSRYSAGARGGAVIPGGSGDSGTVTGGSGNTIVEYTGPTLNFNGDEYVPKSAVPEIIGAATKQGAMAGKAQTFNALKNSRSQRASLGL